MHGVCSINTADTQVPSDVLDLENKATDRMLRSTPILPGTRCLQVSECFREKNDSILGGGDLLHALHSILRT